MNEDYLNKQMTPKDLRKAIVREHDLKNTFSEMEIALPGAKCIGDFYFNFSCEWDCPFDGWLEDIDPRPLRTTPQPTEAGDCL